ncbi:MAG: 4-hydroxy-tetrahydrodipicolinate reductase [Bacteroidetes bacterium]|nr:4-hydroxy-tetrahydrodipicolinate reductase [Bacteroidota bacterium]
MKIALFGYGKMGKEIEQIALSRKNEIGLIIDLNNINSYSVAELKKCDAAIEFSTPDTAVSNIYKCFEAGVPVVVGTTGWLKQWDEVAKVCKERDQTLFWASNFSVGVNLFFKLNEYLAKLMQPHSEYNVTMEEIHHIHKKDAPSGTGITLAEGVLKNMPGKKNWVNNETNKPGELQLVSKRIDEVPGTHSIRYSSEVDYIEITHVAHSRKGFALGAVLAAEWIKGKKGIYGMNDMLKI